MNHNCPCPRRGCVKTAQYMKRDKEWDGRTCPHCGNAITKKGSNECPCTYKFCPCMNRDTTNERTREACPCINANCGCLDKDWKRTYQHA